MKKQNYDKATAQKVCGKMEQQTLSPRQIEIVQRLDAGDLQKVIALDLGISERTVQRVAAEWRDMAGLVV
jgi:DNA-binding NarL/FixJ family response regulator